MSARDTLIPNRAFRDRLRNLQQRSERAARRLQWISAAVDVRIDGPVDVAMADLGPAIDSGLHVMAETTLEAGNWTVFCCTYWAPVLPSWVNNTGVCGGFIYAGDELLASTTSSGLFGPTVLERPLYVVGSVTLLEPTVVTFKVSAQSDSAVGSGEFYQIRLAAVGT